MKADHRQTGGAAARSGVYRLNLRFEGNREWNWAVRDLDDRQLLAAAEFARRNRFMIARSIPPTARASCTTSQCAIPRYRDVAEGLRVSCRLDEAWVYG
jgi:soluble lytic murein transglycosylase